MDASSPSSSSGVPIQMPLIRGETADEEKASIRELKVLLDSIPGHIARHDKMSDLKAKPTSELAADDRLTNPVQLSHLISYGQGVAVDTLRAVRELINPLGDVNLTLPLVAAYPLLRTAIESSVQTSWLLIPGEQKERISRLVRARASEIRFDQALNKSFIAGMPTNSRIDVRSRDDARRELAADRKRKRKYLTDVCSANGLPFTVLEEDLPGYGEMAFASAERSGANPYLLKGMWQYVSGLTHPSAARGVDASSIQERRPAEGNIISGHFTVNVGRLNQVIVVALRSYRDADQLWRYRMLKVIDR